MELTGRVTGNAVVKTLPDGKEVVNFSIAINEYHKPKGEAEAKQKTLYVNCHYWQHTTIAKYLVKAAVVEVEGRAELRAYLGKDGQTKASLNFQCRHIKLFGVTAKGEVIAEEGGKRESVAKVEHIAAMTDPIEDVPF